LDILKVVVCIHSLDKTLFIVELEGHGTTFGVALCSFRRPIQELQVFGCHTFDAAVNVSSNSFMKTVVVQRNTDLFRPLAAFGGSEVGFTNKYGIVEYKIITD